MLSVTNITRTPIPTNLSPLSISLIHHHLKPFLSSSPRQISAMDTPWHPKTRKTGMQKSSRWVKRVWGSLIFRPTSVNFRRYTKRKSLRRHLVFKTCQAYRSSLTEKPINTYNSDELRRIQMISIYYYLRFYKYFWECKSSSSSLSPLSSYSHLDSSTTFSALLLSLTLLQLYHPVTTIRKMT